MQHYLKRVPTGGHKCGCANHRHTGREQDQLKILHPPIHFSLHPETSTLRCHGTVITTSCNAAASPSLWKFRLPGTIKRTILGIWRQLWRKVGLWTVELQLQRPEHGASSDGLLQSQTCSWLVTYCELGSRSFSEFPYRPKVSKVNLVLPTTCC